MLGKYVSCIMKNIKIRMREVKHRKLTGAVQFSGSSSHYSPFLRLDYFFPDWEKPRERKFIE